MCVRTILLLVCFLILPPPVWAAETQDSDDPQDDDEGPSVFEDIAEPPTERKVKLYRSPSERREAGLGRKLTDWLSVSGLAEVESEYQDFRFTGNKTGEVQEDSVTSLQLSMNLTLSEKLTGEFVFEYEVNTDHSLFEEGILKYEGEEFGVEAGRLYIPFGEYYSHFVTGPILEFGETRGDAVVFEYALTDSVDVYAYGIEGTAQQHDSSARIDWGGGFEYASEDESVKVNAGYYSDMADTDEMLLEDFDNEFTRRVGGLAVNALVGMETYEVTAEYVGALRSFSELEDIEDRPWGANLEVAWFPLDHFQLAGRIEASDEVPDEPELQYGASVTWLLGYRLNLSVDYLYGRYRDDTAFDDKDNEIKSRHLVAAQLSFEF